MVEKLICDNEVAVIYSPGCGAGWSTWNDEKERMIFDPVIAQMILDSADIEAVHKIAKERYPDAFLGGLEDCEVKWLPIGQRFYIDEYDGSETIRTNEDLVFIA
jgi:hypothetical protein